MIAIGYSGWKNDLFESLLSFFDSNTWYPTPTLTLQAVMEVIL
jgi:hypothetical protein